MKAVVLFLGILCISQGFNFNQCGLDVEGLAVSYVKAVINWNKIVYYKQAIQEMGYALQFLGAALIDCNPLNLFFAEHSMLRIAGERLTNYNGPTDEFNSIITYATENLCEEKLDIIYENAEYYLRENKGVQYLMQSLHDFVVTCKVGGLVS